MIDNGMPPADEGQDFPSADKFGLGPFYLEDDGVERFGLAPFQLFEVEMKAPEKGKPATPPPGEDVAG